MKFFKTLLSQPRFRWAVLGLALVVLLMLNGQVWLSSAPIAQPARSLQSTQAFNAARSTAQARENLTTWRAELLDPSLDIFQPASQALALEALTPAPPEVVEPAPETPVTPEEEAPPAPPSPPPLPFSLIGQWKQNGQHLVYLSSAQGVVAVKQGDALPGDYRVTELTREQATLTYLPTQQTHVLPLEPLD